MINPKNSEWTKKTDFYNNGDRFYLSPLASTIRLIDRLDGQVIREFYSFGTSFPSKYWDEEILHKAQRECLKMNEHFTFEAEDEAIEDDLGEEYTCEEESCRSVYGGDYNGGLCYKCWVK